MWVTKLLISPVKKRIFCQKKVQIWPQNGIFVHFGQGLAGSFGWWMWRAGCISQDTYLLYGIKDEYMSKEIFFKNNDPEDNTLRKRWHLLNVSNMFVIFLVLCVFYLHSKLYSGRSIKDKSSMVWKHAHCRKGSTFEQI